ncbi:MAG: TetR/AcrR family transcriptional regulator [Actinobacteria bacterium]|nr:TetR/AcrR family transcriptional regulator [Actinomycetota bacterium]
MSSTPLQPEVATTHERISTAAIEEILKCGVLGLRIANVAKGAKVSIALIHKYFGNREGLIAEVLADRIESDYKRENNVNYPEMRQPFRPERLRGPCFLMPTDFRVGISMTTRSATIRIFHSSPS